MIQNILDTSESLAGVVLIPFLQSDSLEEELEELSEYIDVKKSFLIDGFSAATAEIKSIITNNKKIFLIGLGKKIHFSTISKAFKKISYQHHKEFGNRICIDFEFLDFEGLTLKAALNGLYLGGYNVHLYKTTEEPIHPIDNPDFIIEIYHSESDGEDLSIEMEEGIALAKSQKSIMDLMNGPGNKVIPETLSDWAVSSGEANGFKVSVLNKIGIKQEGLGALEAVSRGSEFDPRFIIMEYKGEGENLPKIGLVGKGVTFDTGGLSIKGHQNMHYMKSDMGGAAAVLGAIEMVAKQKLAVELVAIVPATDNCVDALAVKPGDVITSYSGKTIEIIDTDAEGRLILADGLSYLRKHFKVDYLIDLATLTGSTVRTLGYHAGGLFCNDDAMAKKLLEAGDETGERLWQLPLWDVYASEIESDVADIKNFHSKPMVGAIVAAKFLELFTNHHPRWAHLDIAGVAFGDSGVSKEKSGTGYGVHLMYQFIKGLLQEEEI